MRGTALWLLIALGSADASEPAEGEARPPDERDLGLCFKRPAFSGWVSRSDLLNFGGGPTEISSEYSVGAEFTFEFLRYRRFPLTPAFLDVAEFRAGPWARVISHLGPGAWEAGLTASLSNLRQPDWGSLMVRVGLGLGSFGAGRVHPVMALGWSFNWRSTALVRVVAEYRPMLRFPIHELVFSVEVGASAPLDQTRDQAR